MLYRIKIKTGKIMEAIKFFGVSKNGKLTVDVPKELDNKELEIMVIASKKLKPGEKETTTKSSDEENDVEGQMI